MEEITISQVTPYAIRYLEEQYVDAFFQKGELMLSSFRLLSNLPNPGRKDSDEGTSSYCSAPINIIGDVSNRYLILCSSLSFNENARCGQKYGILIKDVNKFCAGIAQAIEDKGLKVKQSFVGPCNYFRREMSFKMANNSPADFLSLLKARFCLEDLLFSKEPEFSFENELRFVFELEEELSDSQKHILVEVPHVIINCCSKKDF